MYVLFSLISFILNLIVPTEYPDDNELNRLFDAYKAYHHDSFTISTKENEERKQIFRTNVNLMVQNNKENNGLTLGMTA